MLSRTCAVTYAGGRGLRDAFTATFPRVPADRYVHVPNGYDANEEEQSPKPACRPSGSPFLLTFVGMYDGLHTPNLFLLGLARHVERHQTSASRLRARFIGYVPEASVELAARLGLGRHVEVYPPVEYRRSLEAMRSSDALLMTLPPLPFSTHWIPAKAYEYLRAGRPILAVVPPGAAADLVRRSPASLVVDPLDRDAIADCLHQLMHRDPGEYESPTDLGDCDRRHAAALFERTLRSCSG
jgi:glycosyltransferase involved in cell wall biosynthesis